MIVAIACDHGGRKLKKIVGEYLLSLGQKVCDFGLPDDQDAGDYPDYARLVAKAVVAGEADMGILICGTGLGMAMAANRVCGARASPCSNEFMARLTRAHNNANILTLGERMTGECLALAIVDVFLKTPFDGGRHLVRLDKLDQI